MGGEAGNGMGTQAMGRPLGYARSPVQGNSWMVCGRLGSAGGTSGASLLILASLAFPLHAPSAPVGRGLEPHLHHHQLFPPL